MNKVFGIIGIVCLYLSVMFFFTAQGNGNIAGKGIFSKVVADITFDSQDSNKWYNADNPKANVQVSDNALPTPVSITVVSYDSH